MIVIEYKKSDFGTGYDEVDEGLKNLQHDQTLKFYVLKEEVKKFNVTVRGKAKKQGMKIQLKTEIDKQDKTLSHCWVRVHIIYRSEKIIDMVEVIEILKKYPELEDMRYKVQGIMDNTLDEMKRFYTCTYNY